MHKSIPSEKKITVLTGTVVSTAGRDTAVVEVNRFVKHPKYRKFMRVTKRYQAHDAGNIKKVGDRVSLAACRPISKHKHFRILTNE